MQARGQDKQTPAEPEPTAQPETQNRNRVGMVLLALGTLLTVVVFYFVGYLPARRAATHERNQRVLATVAGRVESALENVPNLLANALRPRASEADPRVMECNPPATLGWLQGVTLQGGYDGFCAFQRESITVEPVESHADASSRYRVVMQPGAHTTAATSDATKATAAMAGTPRAAANGPEGPSPVPAEKSFEASFDLGRFQYLSDLDPGRYFDNILVVRGEGADMRVVYRDHAQGPAPLLPSQLVAALSAMPSALDESLPNRGAEIGEIRIGPTRYWVYAHPIQVKFGGERQRWALFALTDRTTLDHQIHRFPLNAMLLVGLVFAVVLLFAPHLKLLVIGPRERLRSGDVFALLMAVVLVIAVSTLTTAALTNHLELSEVLDRTAADLAEQVAGDVQQYLEDSAWVLSHFVSDTTDRVGVLDEAGRTCLTTSVIDVTDEQLRRGRPCLLDRQPVEAPDGFDFQQLIWLSDDGWQLAKLVPRGTVTSPLIDVGDRDYYVETKAGLYNTTLSTRDGLPSASSLERVGDDVGLNLHMVRSRNNGKPYLTISASLGPEQRYREVGPVVQLTTSLEMMQQVGLPPGMQLAIVDGQGLVWMHSDTHRALDENLSVETDEEPRLGALLATRRPGRVSAYYHQKPHSLYVHAIPGTDLSAVVLVDDDLLSVTATEVVLRAATLSVLPLLTLAMIGLLLLIGAYGRGADWLWPRPTARARHLAVTGGLLCIGLGQWLLIGQLAGRAGGALLVLCPVLALVMTRVYLAPPGRRRVPSALLLLGALAAGFLTLRLHALNRSLSVVAAGASVLAGLVLPYVLTQLQERRPFKRKDQRAAVISYVTCASVLVINLAALPTLLAFADSEHLAAHAWTTWPDQAPREPERGPRAPACHIDALPLPPLGRTPYATRLSASAALVGPAGRRAEPATGRAPCAAGVQLAQIWPAPHALTDTSAAIDPAAASVIGIELRHGMQDVRDWIPPLLWLLVLGAVIGEVWLVATRVFGCSLRPSLASAAARFGRYGGSGRLTIRLQVSEAQESALLAAPGAVAVDASRPSQEALPDGTEHVVVHNLDHALFRSTGVRFLLDHVAVWVAAGHTVTLLCDREPEELLRVNHIGERSLDPDLQGELAQLWALLSRFDRRSAFGSDPTAALARQLDRVQGLAPAFRELLLSECAFDAKLHDTAVALAEDCVAHDLVPDARTLRKLRGRLSARVMASCHAAWAVRTLDEQFTLAFLAEEGFVNPRSFALLADLEQKGLVFRSPQPRIGPSGLAEIAREQLDAGGLSRLLEREDVPWKRLRVPIMAIVTVLFLTVLFFQPSLGASLVALFAPLVAASTGINKLLSGLSGS